MLAAGTLNEQIRLGALKILLQNTEIHTESPEEVMRLVHAALVDGGLSPPEE